MNMVEIYTLANEELKARRSNAIIKAESNRIKALQSNDYMQIANKIGDLTIKLAKAVFKGNDEAKEFEVQLNKAKEDEKKILSKIGLTTDDLEPKFTCTKCNDKGYIGNKYCDCFNNLIAEYTNKYNLNSSKPISFEDCNLVDSKIVSKVKAIMEKYPNETKYLNIYFTGDIGTGKTQLTQAIANMLISKKLFVIFTTATNLNNNFLEFHKTFNEDKINYLHHFLECDALIIDDLGTEPMLQNVTKEYMLMLISERIATNKLTIISSNLNNRQFLNRYGERLFSRLFNKNNSITFLFSGKDLRLPDDKSKKENKD